MTILLSASVLPPADPRPTIDLLRQAEHDARTVALDRLLAEHEAEHGEITDEEIRAATRSSRSRSLVVRPSDARSSHGSA